MPSTKTCPACQGSGVRLVPKLIKGRRVRVKERCNTCHGKGRIWIEK